MLFAEDHTHQVLKNYYRRKQLGAEALWDMATETGEIACAILVRSTKTTDMSHAAKQVQKRGRFSPKAMYSDRWPTKDTFWEVLFGNRLTGRLGLFHFIQRITRTLRKQHVDHASAVASDRKSNV